MRRALLACLIAWATPVVAQAPGSQYNEIWSYYALIGDSGWSQGNVVLDQASFDTAKGSDGRVHVNVSAALIANMQAQINTLNAQVTSLRTQVGTSSDAKVAFFDSLNSKCVTCIDAINAALAQYGSMYGVIICCGPTTLPPTPPGSQLIYLLPADPADPFSPAIAK